MKKIRKFCDMEMETVNREEVGALQLHRLKRQLRRCYQDSEFYKEKFKEAGVKPDDVRSLDDIIHFPFVTKLELRDEQFDFPPFGRHTVAPPETWAELHPSSGTTGT